MLKFIKASSPFPWVCIGDFNEVLHRSEHVGVQERSHAQIDGFREMVDVCGLHDLGCQGRNWTFEKRVAGGLFAECDWTVLWPRWMLTVLTTKIRPSKPRVREDYTTSFMHIFDTNKVP
jgi:hypothetical protein